jgi:SAM-dependent methyltransferase
MWEAITRASSDQVQGTTVADFGCGPGRFLDVVRRKGGAAVGIDLSIAVEAARENFACDPGVLIVQGDICNPPFREGVFEGGYAIGVLHHTPDPQKALRALVRTVRPGGWVACVVYPSTGFYAYRSVARFRRLVNRLRPVFGYRHALAYSYLSAFAFAPLFRQAKRVSSLNRLLQHIQENWVVVLDHLPDFRWRVLDTFDAITPLIASTHTGDEVKSWMRAAGCTNIETAGWGDTSVLGVRA